LACGVRYGNIGEFREVDAPHDFGGFGLVISN
jgi:hypothetical protein